MNTQVIAAPQADLHEIRLTVTSDGTTGKDWIGRLEKKGFCLSDFAKEILRFSPEFIPTKGVTYEVVIIKSSFWEANGHCNTLTVRDEAEKRSLATPNAEVACLLREVLTDAQIKAAHLSWISVMHEPVITSDVVPKLLGLGCYVRMPEFNAYYDRSDWDSDDGFAFVLPQG